MKSLLEKLTFSIYGDIHSDEHLDAMAEALEEIDVPELIKNKLIDRGVEVIDLNIVVG